MRSIILGIILPGIVALIAAEPALAQKVLSSEPLLLDPYSVVLINNGACSPGKVLKVVGAIKGLHRRKTCVVLDDVTGATRAKG
jgi:hypothetical protein